MREGDLGKRIAFRHAEFISASPFNRLPNDQEIPKRVRDDEPRIRRRHGEFISASPGGPQMLRVSRNEFGMTHVVRVPVMLNLFQHPLEYV